MKVLAFNGSPRKNRNTATLLQHALDGAASEGAETELIHLYDLQYKGCVSCFSCKLKDGASYGKCAVNDDLKPIFRKIEEADALVFGSPIFFHLMSGEMRSFLERLLFQYHVYDADRSSLYGKQIPTGFIFTMGAPQSIFEKRGYEQGITGTLHSVGKIFGSCEPLYAVDTYQFDDYSKYVWTIFDVEEKERRRREVFPEDCRKAFEMGVRLARPANI